MVWIASVVSSYLMRQKTLIPHLVVGSNVIVILPVTCLSWGEGRALGMFELILALLAARREQKAMLLQGQT